MEQLRTKDLRGYGLGHELLAMQAAVAPKNRVSAREVNGAAQTGGAQPVVVLACVVRPRMSGIFQVTVDTTSFLSAAAPLLSYKLFYVDGGTTPFPANLVNGTETSAGSSVFYLNANANGVTAAGLTFGGAPTNSIYTATLGPGSNNGVNAQLGGLLGPFTQGNYIAFGILETLAAPDTSTSPVYTISAMELP